MRNGKFPNWLCLCAHTRTHTRYFTTSSLPQLAACLDSSFVQTARGMDVNVIIFLYPFPAARGFPSTWAMQFAFLATVFAHAVVFSHHLAYVCINGSKWGLGALVHAAIAEGREFCTQATALSALGRLPGKTPLCAVPASPGDLAAHPGLGVVPLEHRDTGAHAARRPSKSIQQVCWQQGWIQAGNVKMFGWSLHTVTEICQPSSDFRLDVLGWRNYDFLVEKELLFFNYC